MQGTRRAGSGSKCNCSFAGIFYLARVAPVARVASPQWLRPQGRQARGRRWVARVAPVAAAVVLAVVAMAIPGLQGLVLAVPVVSMAQGLVVLAAVVLSMAQRPEQQLGGAYSCSVSSLCLI